MSLAYLLDENISGKVAVQIARKRPDIPMQNIHDWRGGALLSADDDQILLAAAEDRLTLVTYDLATIPDYLNVLAEQGHSHGGVLFVDQCTIAQNDFGGLALALIVFWDAHKDWDWTNRVAFLEAVDAQGRVC